MCKDCHNYRLFVAYKETFILWQKDENSIQSIVFSLCQHKFLPSELIDKVN